MVHLSTIFAKISGYYPLVCPPIYKAPLCLSCVLVYAFAVILTASFAFGCVWLNRLRRRYFASLRNIVNVLNMFLLPFAVVLMELN